MDRVSKGFAVILSFYLLNSKQYEAGLVNWWRGPIYNLYI